MTTTDSHPHQAAPHAPSNTSANAVQTPHETMSITHAEFCRGLSAGEFHLIVDPVKSRKYIRQRLFLLPLMLPVVGIGAALAISGHPWIGLALILGGGFVHRIVTHQAPKILLHLAIKDPRTYFEAIEYEMLEVRLRQS
jgi:hypothetical protein